jgi:hypothetical protein
VKGGNMKMWVDVRRYGMTSSRVGGVTPEMEPEMIMYLEHRADFQQEAPQPSEAHNMPGLGMSAEHQMPSREMNESSGSITKSEGDMPHPIMG